MKKIIVFAIIALLSLLIGCSPVPDNYKFEVICDQPVNIEYFYNHVSPSTQLFNVICPWTHNFESIVSYTDVVYLKATWIDFDINNPNQVRPSITVNLYRNGEIVDTMTGAGFAGVMYF